jgi:predicted metal-dependent HD superfamily phosphohydrolase
VKAPDTDRWIQLWRQITATGNVIVSYQELVSLYSQPDRHYHNLRHIAECLAQFDSARRLACQPVAVELAIWFHDAIYDTHAQDNEEKSAELARQRISEAGGDKSLCASVATLILATKVHDASLHPDAPLIVDVDLSILGQTDERFQEYEAQIRREYDWVLETIFAAKRAEILERFLERDRIYTTDEFFVKYEQQARINLQNSLCKLKAEI